MTPTSPQVLVVAATEGELAGLRDRIVERADLRAATTDGRLGFLVTGVGPVATAAALTEVLLTRGCDLVLNVGLAGALTRALALGSVVEVARESFGDLGAEDRDGRPMSLFELGFAEAHAGPYRAGWLHSPPGPRPCVGTWPQVAGVTVSQTHGEATRIRRFRAAHPEAEVETMEGAAVFWCAFRQNVPAVQLRAISNYVEPRDRAAWQIGPALRALDGAGVTFLTAALATGPDAAAASPPPSR